MSKEGLLSERDRLRDQWRRVRASRLEMKAGLMSVGMSDSKIWKYPPYKKLKKEQRRLSRMIIHFEKQINRKKPGKSGCENQEDYQDYAR